MQVVTFLSDPLGIALTPNGRTLYVANQSSNTVLTFTRDVNTGALTQKTGAAGCMGNTGNGTTCRDGRALAGAGT